MSAVISVQDYLDLVAGLLGPVANEVRRREPGLMRVSDPRLVGRVSAAAVHGALDLPPFDNSQMDGYAVRASDLAGATERTVVQLPISVATAAGDAPNPHEPGTASPVMTGAPMPIGADAVVPVEATVPPRFPALSRAGEPLHPAQIGFSAEPAEGHFVRFRGEDQRAGDLIVDEGQRLTPARIGALASAGVAEVPVRQRMRVLVCTTGDELHLDEGAQLAPGRIHDANSPMLAALLHSEGAEVRTVRCEDDALALQRLVASEGPNADLIVTSGGISAGAFEVVREAFAPLGAQFVSVAMQPGGPQGFGSLELPGSSKTVAALCFPGNPVSSLLSAVLFLVPTLRALAGLEAQPTGEWRPLAAEATSPEHKLQLRRGVIEADGSVTLLAPGSHLLHDLAVADVIAQIPEGVAFCEAGTPVFTWRINV